MAVFGWLKRKSAPLSDAAAYPMAEKQMMLWVAKQIRKNKYAATNATHMMATMAALSTAVTSLRRQYGMDVIERNCPVERLFEAYANRKNLEWANTTFDALIHDILAFRGDDDRTWLRLAYMLNPNSMQDIARELGFPKV